MASILSAYLGHARVHLDIHLQLVRAAVVAQQKSVCLVTERSWVRIMPGAGLFSPLSSASLIQVPQGGATLMIFVKNRLSCAA